MASLGHIAVGMAAGRIAGGPRPARAMVFFAALSLLPDVDVVGMAFGVPYKAPWGHRGATHSIAMALLLAAVVGLGAAAWGRPNGRRAVGTGFLAALVLASHGLLDAMTDGGKGVALLWPFSLRRFFLPWRPIPVAPIGVDLVSWDGLQVMAWEALVFLPLFAFALWPRRPPVASQVSL
jgi:inner membrane protein